MGQNRTDEGLIPSVDSNRSGVTQAGPPHDSSVKDKIMTSAENLEATARETVTKVKEQVIPFAYKAENAAKEAYAKILEIDLKTEFSKISESIKRPDQSGREETSASSEKRSKMSGELLMYCMQCGQKIPSDSKFCSNCGHKL
jgi:rubrerythrin